MNHLNKDENSAPDQVDQGKPTVVGADRAAGIAGAEPPLETEAASVGHRHRSAAGLYSIWETTKRVCHQALDEAGKTGADLRAIGITNQRETSVAWDRNSG